MPSRLRRSSSATDCFPSGPPGTVAPAGHRRPDRVRTGVNPAPAGFTLLEVVVALAILGIGLGVVFQGISQGLRLRGASADGVRLALVAESVLGRLVERESAPTEPEEGEEFDCRWRLEPLEGPRRVAGAATAPDRRGAALIAVRVTVTAPAGGSWEATTLLPREKAAAP